MMFRPSVAVIDACVLYPFHLRNIVVQAAVDRLIQGRWTNEIHDEWMRGLAGRAPNIPHERLEATRSLMNEALPTATIRGYEDHIAAVSLPDPGDRHVVAAAIAAKASVILTWNLRHFPAKEWRKFGLLRETPDAFLSGLYDKVPGLMLGSLANARRNLSKSNISATDFLEILRNQNLVQLAKRVEKHLTDL